MCIDLTKCRFQHVFRIIATNDAHPLTRARKCTHTQAMRVGKCDVDRR